MKLSGANVPLNPVVLVPKHLKADVVTNPTKQIKKHPTVISPEDMGTLNRPHRLNSMPATSTASLSTIECFHTEDEPDQRASNREESLIQNLESLKMFDKYYPYIQLSPSLLNNIFQPVLKSMKLTLSALTYPFKQYTYAVLFKFGAFVQRNKTCYFQC